MIKIKINGRWKDASYDYRQMFIKYRERNRYSEIPLTENGWTISRDNNDPYNGIFIQTETNKLPICDWNDVKIFLVNVATPDWYSARDYQTWAFFDFIYDNKLSKNYVSPGSLYNSGDTIIDIDNILPGIIFRIYRNSNNSIEFERNDEHRTRCRISDNEWARLGYRGFYTRLTMDPGIIIIPPNTNTNHSNKLQLPIGLIAVETNEEKEQCILCVTNKINICYLPCNHFINCSECYIKMENNLCPLCKTSISNINPI
jgi:hypothetical protein